MHRAAENRREIERQHREALENLKRKQDEVEITATKKQEEFINQLKLRIDDLESEKRAQNERHQELILEMAEIRVLLIFVLCYINHFTGTINVVTYTKDIDYRIDEFWKTGGFCKNWKVSNTCDYPPLFQLN